MTSPNAPRTVRMSNGRDVDINNVLSEDIDIFAIAHALSQICRWGGHCGFFYSVAQHSLYAAEIALITTKNEAFAKKVLLHDANEAFLSDVPSPLKRFSFMDAFTAIEHSLQRQIWRHFKCDPEDDPKLTEIDAGLIAIESRQMMPYTGDFLANFPLPRYSFSIKRIPRDATVRDMYREFLLSPAVTLISDWTVDR